MQSLQTSLSKFLKQQQTEEDSDSNDRPISPDKESTKLPDMWTRVIKCSHSISPTFKAYNIEQDLQKDQTLKEVRRSSVRSGGSMQFDPEVWKGRNDELTFDNHQLEPDNLRAYAITASQIRSDIRTRALACVQNDSEAQKEAEQQYELHQLQLKRRYSKRLKPSVSVDLLTGLEHNSTNPRRKRKKMNELSVETTIKIGQAARNQRMTHKEIAIAFDVNVSVVSAISSSLKRDTKLIEKRQAREQTRSLRQAPIFKVIRELLETGTPIYSAKQIQGVLLQQYGIKSKQWLILKILKQNFQLSYRKIKRVPFHGNSERNKVLRSLYGQKMLQIYASGKRVINVDESWVPLADFHRRRWRKRGMVNSCRDKPLSQKINIITAMSTDGDVWFALTTCNTDSQVLMLFMTHLAKELTKDSRDWRENTCFLLDGASYHKSPESRSCYQHLGLSIILSAPYSYSAAPVELWFARLKQGDLNPDHIPSGKRAFKDVTRLIYEHAQKIKKSTCILCFHHCILHCFQYLMFEPL